jgi:hypothetical protein
MRKSEVYHARIDPETMAMVRAACKAQKVSVSEFMREALQLRLRVEKRLVPIDNPPTSDGAAR